jgi:hypothetical protein
MKIPRARRLRDIGFKGIAALGELSRAHMGPDLAAMVLESLGLSLSDPKQAEADPYVLEALQ